MLNEISDSIDEMIDENHKSILITKNKLEKILKDEESYKTKLFDIERKREHNRHLLSEFSKRNEKLKDELGVLEKSYSNLIQKVKSSKLKMKASVDLINFLNLKQNTKVTKESNVNLFEDLKKYELEGLFSLNAFENRNFKFEDYTQVLYLEKFNLSDVTYTDEPHPYLEKYLNNYNNIPNDLYHEWIEIINVPRNDLKEKLKSIALFTEIPKLLRGQIWKKLCKDKLKITKNDFRNCVPADISDLRINKRTNDLILADILRSFPKANCLILQHSFKNEIQKILQGFTIFRPDIGYVQGMTYLAIVLKLHMETFAAFTVFSNLMVGNDFLFNLYTFNKTKINIYFAYIEKRLNKIDSNLQKHFKNIDLSHEIILIEWFYTLLSRSFTMDNLVRIWDLYFIYGEFIFLEVVLLIMIQFKENLINETFEQNLLFLRNCVHLINEDQILIGIKKSLSQFKEYQKFLTKMM